MKRRILSALTALALLLTMCPLGALAADTGGDDEIIFITEPLEGEMFTMETEPVLPSSFFNLRQWSEPSGFTNNVYEGYRNQLEEDAKKVYDDMKTAFAEPQASATITLNHTFENATATGTTSGNTTTLTLTQEAEEDMSAWMTENVTAAYLALRRDHPEMPWIAAEKFGVGKYGYEIDPASPTPDGEGIYTFNAKVVSVPFNLTNVPAEISSGKTTFETKVNDVFNELKSSVDAANSAYDKVKAIHDKVCVMITYDKTTQSPYNQTAYSAFVGTKTVCAGYGTSFKLLCDKFNIPCVYVSGLGGGTNKEAHGWNYVKMDNANWYAVDCTWDDNKDDNENPFTGFFLVGSNTVAPEIYTDVKGTPFSDNHVSDGAWLQSDKTLVFPYPALSDVKYDNKQTPICNPPTGVEATYGQKLSDIASKLTNPAGNTAGEWSWETPDTLVGDVSTSPHKYKAKFTPTDTANYNIVSGVDVSVTVTAKSLTDAMIEAIPAQEYTDGGVTPEVNIKDGDNTLVKGTDYTVAYANNTAAGEATVTVTGTGNYQGTASAKFTIEKKTATITITPNTAVTYDGEAVTYGKSNVDIIYMYTGDAEITDANVKWYDKDDKELTGQDAPPQNVGNYKIGISAAESNGFKAVAEVKESFTITPADYQFTSAEVDPATYPRQVSIRDTLPASSVSMQGKGVKTEKVSGTLKWYTTDARTEEVDSTKTFETEGKKTLYWTFTPDGTAENYKQETKTGDVEFTVTGKDPQRLSFAQSEVTTTFEGTVTPNSLTNSVTTGAGAITYTSSKPEVATVDANDGTVTIVGAGTTVITATAAATDDYAQGEASYTLIVNPKPISVTVEVVKNEDNALIFPYQADGVKPEVSSVKISSTSTELEKDKDYVVTYENNDKVGTDAKVVVSPKEGGNYTWTPVKTGFTITKATYEGEKTGESSAGAGKGGTFDLTSLHLPEGCTLVPTSPGGIITGTPTINDAKTLLTYTIAESAKVGETAEITINVTNPNYENFDIKVKVTVSNLISQDITFQSGEVKKVYGDADFAYQATDTAGRKITYTSGDITIATVNAENGTVHIVKPGTVTITATAESNNTYTQATASYTLTIDKATVTITAANKSAYVGDSAPALGSGDYTITGLVGDDKLVGDVNIAYASTPDMSRAGTVSIVVSGVSVPSTEKYNETIQYVNGTLTISTRSTSGGNTGSSGGGGKRRPSGSSSSTPTHTTTKNPQTGAVVETTKNPDGSRTQVTTETDGTVSTRITDANGVVSCEVSIPSGVNEKSLPISSLRATKDSANAPTLTIFAQADVKVKVPVSNLTPGVVAMVVGTNGKQEILKTSVPETDGLSFTAHGDVTIKIVDNSKTFSDVKASDWHKKAVDFASARSLFKGTSDMTFSPESPMTRGMLAMVLHNLEDNPPAASNIYFPDVAAGAWYADAVRWASAKGIISGYDNGQVGAEDDISREQLAVILWRYAGSPAASSSTLNFTDAAMASGYATSALSWATEVGIISGTGNGALSPKAQASRAQVAQMLKNFITVMN